MTDAEKKRQMKAWEDFHRSYMSDLSVNIEETEAEKLKRIERLEAHPEEWFDYYFGKYSERAGGAIRPAWFHKAATQRLINNGRWYEVRAWSRGFAKSTRTMFEVLYLALTGQIRNIILVSASYDGAEKLLLPYKIALEDNKRIINDYGEQKSLNLWESGKFTTRKGVSFFACGAGQTPRGAKNEAVRPDCILIDDIDTDEEVRNPDRIKTKWEWIEQALIPTVNISQPYRILFCGNIIGKDTCITRAIEKADYADIVNQEDGNGHSNWPEKVSDADIAYMKSKISTISYEKEYMNNPLSVGQTFKEMRYGKMLPLRKYEALCCYTDPSFKDSKKNDFKFTVLVGKYGAQFHVIKAFGAQTTTDEMISWHYSMMDIVGLVSCYYYMEANFLQDTILEKFKTAAEKGGKVIPITGDTRDKPEKFTRIESLLEPLNREGQLILNEEEKGFVGMQKLEEQFLLLGPGSRAHDDGPDAVEGAVWMLNNKLRKRQPPIVGTRPDNSKRI